MWGGTGAIGEVGADCVLVSAGSAFFAESTCHGTPLLYSALELCWQLGMHVRRVEMRMAVCLCMALHSSPPARPSCCLYAHTTASLARKCAKSNAFPRLHMQPARTEMAIETPAAQKRYLRGCKPHAKRHHRSVPFALLFPLRSVGMVRCLAMLLAYLSAR